MSFLRNNMGSIGTPFQKGVFLSLLYRSENGQDDLQKRHGYVYYIHG